MSGEYSTDCAYSLYTCAEVVDSTVQDMFSPSCTDKLGVSPYETKHLSLFSHPRRKIDQGRLMQSMLSNLDSHPVPNSSCIWGLESPQYATLQIQGKNCVCHDRVNDGMILYSIGMRERRRRRRRRRIGGQYTWQSGLLVPYQGLSLCVAMVDFCGMFDS